MELYRDWFVQGILLSRKLSLFPVSRRQPIEIVRQSYKKARKICISKSPPKLQNKQKKKAQKFAYPNT